MRIVDGHVAKESINHSHAELINTGERLVADGCERRTVTEHLHRYAFAALFTGDKAILDIACGEGYGSALLARRARRVVGVDIAAEAIQHAQRKYKCPTYHSHKEVLIRYPCNLTPSIWSSASKPLNIMTGTMK